MKDDDYKIIHGKGYYGAYLNKSTTSKLYKVLNEVFPDAKEGSHVFAEYNYNADAIPQRWMTLYFHMTSNHWKQVM